jgi:hypothetical protein
MRERARRDVSGEQVVIRTEDGLAGGCLAPVLPMPDLER